jgi:hypothetical protein
MDVYPISLLYKGKQPPSFFLLAERQMLKTKTKKHGAYSILSRSWLCL